jgi:predicted dehydrogenase
LWKGEAVFIPFEGERRVLPPLPVDGIYPDRGPLDNFVDAALGLAPNGSDGRLGFAAMQVIEAAVESSKSNRPVKVFT